MASEIQFERWGAPPEITVRPPASPSAPSSQPPIVFEKWGTDEPKPPMGVGQDIIASGASGLVRGAAETAMAPVSLARLGQQGVGWLMDKAEGGIRSLIGADPISAEEQQRRAQMSPGPISGAIYAGQDAVRGAMDAALHKPETTAGEYARTMGEFAPALLNPGSAGQKVAGWAIPALASETAGQVTKGTKAEPWARGGAALVAGLGTAALSRPGTPGALIAEGAEGVDEATMNADMAAARQLLDDASSRGVRLTPVEALNQVSNGRYRRLGAVQRSVENSRRGGPVMDEFMSDRPGQVATAGRAALDDLQPRTMDPTATGTRMQEGAEGVIGDAMKARTAAADPFYKIAASDRVPDADVDGILKDIDRMIGADETGILATPLGELRDKLTAQRATPGVPSRRIGRQTPTGATIYSQTPSVPPTPRVPVTDVENLDRARKFFRDRTELPQFAEKAIDKETGAKVGNILSRLDDSMENASPAFSRGKQIYQEETTNVVQPLVSGPMGRIAETPSVTQQRATLLPPQPEAGMAPSVGQTVAQIAARDPEAASNFVRQHAETVFNTATKNLQSGPNQFGGAKFAAALRANPEQAASLESAVRALPNGDVRWAGFDRFLRIMDATGQRLQRGSETAFNQQITKELQGGTLIGETASLAGGGGLKLPERIKEAYQSYRYGRNTAELARILTDDRALPLFERLLRQAPAGNRARTTALRLLTLGTTTGTAVAAGQPK